MRVLVTGASRGIGRELCLFFSDLGHEVLAVARSEEPLRRLAGENPNIEAWPMDINQWQELADQLGERYDHLDILVHNAAAFINRPFREVALEDMKQVYHTNVFVPYFLTQSLLPLLRRGSQVLAISSVGGQGGSMKFPGLSVYSSSKGALNILVECLATELGEEGIIVNGLALGSSATEMFKAAFPDMEAASSPEDMAKFIGNFAIQSPGLVQGKVYSVSSSNP